MGKKKEKEYVYLKNEPKPYGLFDFSDAQVYIVVGFLLFVAGIAGIIWLWS